MFKIDRPEKVAWGFVILAAVVAVGGFAFAHSGSGARPVGPFGLATLTTDFYANVAVELLSIGITVLVIDGLHQRQQRKQRLIIHLRSRHPDTVRDAFVECRKNGWVKDGSLAHAELQFADLSEVDLTHANLQGARLEHARFPAQAAHVNLRDADLSNAVLDGADLSYAKLEGAILEGVDLTTTTLTGAEYNSRTHWPAGVDPAATGALLRK